MSTPNQKNTNIPSSSSPQKPEIIPASGEKVLGKVLYNAMDNNNKKAADVMASKGVDAAVEHMFKHPKTGEPMDYATMRYYYG